MKRTKEEIARDKAFKKSQIEEKKYFNNIKKLAKKELAILKFMYKTDVFFFHHNTKDSLRLEIKNRIQIISKSLIDNSPIYKEYNSYWMYYNNEQSHYMPMSLLYNYTWINDTFPSIYDVPLDGSYLFYCYDSGLRGLGSMNRISVEKSENEFKIPFVNSGAMIPITA